MNDRKLQELVSTMVAHGYSSTPTLREVAGFTQGRMEALETEAEGLRRDVIELENLLAVEKERYRQAFGFSMKRKDEAATLLNRRNELLPLLTELAELLGGGEA